MKDEVMARQIIRRQVHPWRETPRDDALLWRLVGDAHYVLIGEASHGTHEFYRERAELTKRLIAEKGFTAVAGEADWPDAWRVNNYVKGLGDDHSAEEALGDFHRFPTWMWRNTVVRDFVEWLRDFNLSRPAEWKVGFYGLDLYSLRASMDAVIGYLDRVDPEAAQRARYRYSCFDQFGEDPQRYGYAASFGMDKTCEDEVVRQLADLRQRAFDYLHRDGLVAEDAYFYTEQNARLVKNAEQYYRSMFHGRDESWNLRDRHMAETLDALVSNLQRRGETRVAVWAHNSHLGDARATEMGRRGELNVGQLVRERHGGDAVLIGFSTHSGTVTAARDWDEPPERRNVRPGLPGSYENFFHQVGIPRFLIGLGERGEGYDALSKPRLERAIGVVYRPETERLSHYFQCELTRQFDALIHLDETRALEPLERTAGWEKGELPETYPYAV